MQSKMITRFEDITEKLDLVNQCLDRGAAIDGLRYNTEVAVNQGRVHAAFSGDEIVGGYVLIHKAPFRILTLTDHFRGDQYSATINQDRLVELGAVWLHPAISSKRDSAKFWFNVARNVAKRKPTHMIYGLNMDRKGLVKLYHRMNPEIMWQGDTTKSNIKTHAHLACEKVKIQNFLVQVMLVVAGRFLWPAQRGITRIHAGKPTTAKG